MARACSIDQDLDPRIDVGDGPDVEDRFSIPASSSRMKSRKLEKVIDKVGDANMILRGD